jgi:hypothetical protein
MGHLALGFRLLLSFTKARGVGRFLFFLSNSAAHLYASVVMMVLETGDFSFRHIGRKRFNFVNANY